MASESAPTRDEDTPSFWLQHPWLVSRLASGAQVEARLIMSGFVAGKAKHVPAAQFSASEGAHCTQGMCQLYILHNIHAFKCVYIYIYTHIFHTRLCVYTDIHISPHV